MNKRTLLIIAAFALPPALLAIIIQSGVPSLKINAPKPGMAQAAPQQPLKKGAFSTAPVTLPPLNQPADNGRYPTAASELDQKRQRVRQRLQVLRKMMPADWPAERERNSHAPATLAQALAHNTQLIAELDAMTPALWAAGQRPAQMGGTFRAPGDASASAGTP